MEECQGPLRNGRAVQVSGELQGIQHFPIPGQQGRFALPQGPAEVGVFQRGQQVAGICPLVQSCLLYTSRCV